MIDTPQTAILNALRASAVLLTPADYQDALVRGLDLCFRYDDWWRWQSQPAVKEEGIVGRVEEAS